MAEGSSPSDPRRRAPVATQLAPVAPADCTTCGACCFSDRDDYIAVFGVDVARMDARALALSHEREGRRFMRFAEGRCVALKRQGDQLLCAIYPMRPDACRWLERASGSCLAQVAEKKERALLMLRRR